MASSALAIIIASLCFSYFVIYRQDRFMGNLFFLFTGLITIWIGYYQESAVYGPFAVIIIAGAIGSMIWDFFTTKTPKRFT